MVAFFFDFDFKNLWVRVVYQMLTLLTLLFALAFGFCFLLLLWLFGFLLLGMLAVLLGNHVKKVVAS